MRSILCAVVAAGVVFVAAAGATGARGTQVYEPGNGVSLPKVEKQVKAEYTSEAKAAKQWTFKPGMKDGKPVAVRVHVEMTFSLK